MVSRDPAHLYAPLPLTLHAGRYSNRFLRSTQPPRARRSRSPTSRRSYVSDLLLNLYRWLTLCTASSTPVRPWASLSHLGPAAPARPKPVRLPGRPRPRPRPRPGRRPLAVAAMEDLARPPRPPKVSLSQVSSEARWRSFAASDRVSKSASLVRGSSAGQATSTFLYQPVLPYRHVPYWQADKVSNHDERQPSCRRPAAAGLVRDAMRCATRSERG
jgi:hypothetical protein